MEWGKDLNSTLFFVSVLWKKAMFWSYGQIQRSCSLSINYEFLLQHSEGVEKFPMIIHSNYLTNLLHVCIEKKDYLIDVLLGS